MQDIVFYAAASETLGQVRDYSNMNNSSAPVLTLGVAVCLRIRLFADIKVPTPYPVASLNGITDWHWSMDADFDRSTACKLVADEGGISVHTVTDTINGSTMSFTEFVIPISNMNTEELAAWLGNDGTKSGLTGELVGYDSEGHAVFVLQIEGFKIRNRVAGLSDPTAVDEGFVTHTTANSMIQTAVSTLAATKQDKLTAGTGVTITGGTQVSLSLAAGERMAVVSGNTVAQLRYFDITNITGSTVTLEAGHAYRLNATAGTKTLFAEDMDDDTFGLEGHIEIFVANTGNIQTGKLAGGTTEVILADALEPNAVNNCTVRFHDHKAIISVEDHVAGHIVTVSSGMIANSLYYWLTQPNTASDAATQYIGFDASLNGVPVSFEGAANTAVKHVVGNGYTQTILTGNVAPAAVLTVSDLSLQHVTVTGGVITIGDAVVAGGIATSNGARIAIEHARLGEDVFIGGGTYTAITDGGVLMGPVSISDGESIVGGGTNTLIDLDGTNVTVSSGTTANVSGLTFTRGSASTGGAFYCSSVASVGFNHCVFSGNVASNGFGNAITCTGGIMFVSSCAFDSASNQSIMATYATVLNAVNTDIPYTVLQRTQTSMTIAGSCSVAKIRGANGTTSSGGSVIVSSGATLDLTGNSEPNPIATGGGIVFEPGGATVLYSSGTVSGSYMMDNVKLPAGAKLTNTAVVALGGAYVVIGSGSTASVSGCTFRGGLAGGAGGAFYISGGTFMLTRVNITGNSASIAAGGIRQDSGVLILSGCSVYGNSSPLAHDVQILSGEIKLTDSYIDNITLNGGEVIVDGSCSAGEWARRSDSQYGTVTLSSGAILDLTGNTKATPIAPGGGITIPAGAVVDVIGSDGSTGSCGHFEGGNGVEIVGASITNTGCIYGATVTFPPSPDSAGQTRGPWDLLTTEGSQVIQAGTEAQTEVISGGLYRITEQ